LSHSVRPKIAICLAAFNGVSWLDEQLDSILGQEAVDVTLFVSVDSSTDGTEELINTRATGDARVNVLPHGGKFGGAAANFFRILRDVQFEPFDYVGFADQDDIWVDGKLSRAVAMLRETGAVGYSSNLMAFWPSGRRRLIQKAQSQRRLDFIFESAGAGCTFLVTKVLVADIQNLLSVRRDDLQGVALHDWFAYALARARGYRWFTDDFVGVLYRQHATNQLGANSGWQPIVRRMRLVLSGWAMDQSALVAELIGYGEHPIVRRGLDRGRLGMLWLMTQSWQCRRRPRDRILFAMACLLLSVSGYQRR
jgi:rhamnosyltransferase